MGNFENMPVDGASKPIPVARREQYFDGTDTPNISPISIGTSWTALVVPEGCAELEVECAEAIVRVATDDGGDDGYRLVPAGSPRVVSVAEASTVFVYGEASGSLSTTWRMMN